MAKEIAIQSTVTELSDQKKVELRKKSQRLMEASVAFGVRRFLYFGAALYNIKTFKLYEGTWKAFREEAGLDDSDAYRYVGIGASMYAHLESTGVFAGDRDPIIQKSDIESHFGPSFDRLSEFTFRELSTLSKKLDIFQNAMTGEELHKLLPPPKEPTNSQIGDARKDSFDKEDVNENMRKALAPYGWVWNAKLRRCEHADGTPLTDSEIAQVTHPDSAFHVFRQVGNRLDSTLDRVKDDIVHDMATYMRYAKAIPNQALDIKVMALRNEVQEKFQTIIQMLDALISCDEKRVKEIRKHGLETA